jgi:hypothetical protein
VPRKLAGEEATALQEAFEEIEEEEDEQLYHSKGWCRELWLESLGLRAVSPAAGGTQRRGRRLSAQRGPSRREAKCDKREPKAARKRKWPKRLFRPVPDDVLRKFLRYFPGGFADETYVEWERGYKWKHKAWNEVLASDSLRTLLREPSMQRLLGAQSVSNRGRTSYFRSRRWRCVTPCVPRSARDSSPWGLPIPARTRERRGPLRALVRDRRIATSQANARPDLADRHRVRVHCRRISTSFSSLW